MASLPQRESRNVERSRFSAEDRILLLEQDADVNDRRHAELLSMMGQIKAYMLGVIITASTATIVGAINLAYGRISSASIAWFGL